MIWLLIHPLPPSPVSKLSLFLSLNECRRSSLLSEEGGDGAGGAKSHDCEKACSSINHSIPSGYVCGQPCGPYSVIQVGGQKCLQGTGGGGCYMVLFWV
jgi:hypothetical protein